MWCVEGATRAVREYLGWLSVQESLARGGQPLDLSRQQSLDTYTATARDRVSEAIQQAYSIVVTVSEANEVQAFKIQVTDGPLFSAIKADKRSRIQDSAISPDAKLPKMLSRQAIVDTVARGVEDGYFVARLRRCNDAYSCCTARALDAFGTVSRCSDSGVSLMLKLLGRLLGLNAAQSQPLAPTPPEPDTPDPVVRIEVTTSVRSYSPTRVDSGPLTVFNGNQEVRVFGGNFAAGLTVDVFNSSGTRIGTLSGTQVKSVTISSFTMVVSLGSSPGSFGMEVVNPDGGRSARFTFATQAASPSVAGISPNPVPTFNADQAVQVTGSSFQGGLVVDVYNSGGAGIATISGTQIVNGNAAGFTMLMNLGATASSFAIEVVNPDGRRSSRFSFSTTEQSPNVSSLNPNPVPVFNGNQDVRVNGSHFQFNLTVDVYSSTGTKIGTLSGTQIKNVTATSFTMVVHLGSAPGNFAMEVVNPSGARSTRFAFTTRQDERQGVLVEPPCPYRRTRGVSDAH